MPTSTAPTWTSAGSLVSFTALPSSVLAATPKDLVAEDGLDVLRTHAAERCFDDASARVLLEVADVVFAPLAHGQEERGEHARARDVVLVGGRSTGGFVRNGLLDLGPDAPDDALRSLAHDPTPRPTRPARADRWRAPRGAP